MVKILSICAKAFTKIILFFQRNGVHVLIKHTVFIEYYFFRFAKCIYLVSEWNVIQGIFLERFVVATKKLFEMKKDGYRHTEGEANKRIDELKNVVRSVEKRKITRQDGCKLWKRRQTLDKNCLRVFLFGGPLSIDLSDEDTYTFCENVRALALTKRIQTHRRAVRIVIFNVNSISPSVCV